MRKICKECGKEFETTSSRRLFCYDKHYRTCVSCGKPFYVEHPCSSVKTCSEACRRQAIASSESYNVPRFKCICVHCGKEFLSAHKDTMLCPDTHYNTCVVCGKKFEIKAYYQIDRATCSNECRYKLSSQKYKANIDNNMAKTHNTMLQRYGTTNPMHVPEFVEKSKQTCLSRYGVTSFTKTPEFISRTVKTNQERYGVDWYMQTDDCKQSVINTCMQKYGVSNAGKYGDFIVDKMKNPDKLPELMSFRDNPERYINEHFTERPTIAQLSNFIGVSETTVGDILLSRDLCHLITYQYSRMEDEIYEFLSEYISTDDIVRNTFKVITPYEPDVYLPKFSLAIECNPTYTHNSTIGIYGKSPKSQDYHKMKTDLCESHGIRLIHIFGYDWSWHKDTCKSIILNVLGMTPHRLYARNLTVKPVSGRDAYNFLCANHRQGGVHCKVRLGLYFNDDLMSLMTFSKMRHTIGTGNDDTSDCWELVRFCNKNYTTVVGGASRLLRHFIQDCNPVEIRSFSDRAHTSGKLYPALGFTELRRSEPGYVWVNLKSDKAYSRFNAQKRNIVKFLNDDNIDLSNSESEIMSEHGFVQVYDSGTITWRLLCKSAEVANE